ncbi:MAG: nickel pincer cofactor biosynthesis protein LarC [Candidatus Manganitrophaceae bacterium]
MTRFPFLPLTDCGNGRSKTATIPRSSRIAYFDCFSGVSGDMILGALIDAGLPIETLQKEVAKLNLPGCAITARPVRRAGIAGTKVEVLNRKNLPPLTTFKEIERQIGKSALSKEIQERSLAVFRRLAKAESEVHGQRRDRVHLHEVGEVDTLVDVAGAVIGLSLLKIDRIVASPIHVGSGMVETESGAFPIPAPATAALLQGVPIYSTGIQGELTTPTGAAILSTLASGFSPLPPMTVEKIAHGAGNAERTIPNLLRLFIGTEQSAFIEDEVVQIETNIDDMNPQLYEQVIESLFEVGALDVFLTPIIMKRGRPAILLTVLSRPTGTSEIIETLFTETTTLGVRLQPIGRKKLDRKIEKRETPHGPIHVKSASRNGRILRERPEFQEVRRIARKKGRPLRIVLEEIERGLKKETKET